MVTPLRASREVARERQSRAPHWEVLQRAKRVVGARIAQRSPLLRHKTGARRIITFGEGKILTFAPAEIRWHGSAPDFKRGFNRVEGVSIIAQNGSKKREIKLDLRPLYELDRGNFRGQVRTNCQETIAEIAHFLKVDEKAVPRGRTVMPLWYQVVDYVSRAAEIAPEMRKKELAWWENSKQFG